MNFKIGDTVRIIHLVGEGREYDDRIGKVLFIDALGQLHGTWGDLAIIPERDIFEIIES